MIQVCCATVWGPNAFHSWACGRKAKIEREKKWYCGTHDPERLQRRRDRYRAAFDEETKARNTIHEAEREIERLGREIPALAALYKITDDARGNLGKAVDARRAVR